MAQWGKYSVEDVCRIIYNLPFNDNSGLTQHDS